MDLEPRSEASVGSPKRRRLRLTIPDTDDAEEADDEVEEEVNIEVDAEVDVEVNVEVEEEVDVEVEEEVDVEVVDAQVEVGPALATTPTITSGSSLT